MQPAPHALQARKRGARRAPPPRAPTATTTRTVDLPDEYKERAWRPRGTPRKLPNTDLWTFLTADELLDVYRPRASGLKSKDKTNGKRTTAEEIYSTIQKLYENSGHDLRANPTPWDDEEHVPPFQAFHNDVGDTLQRASRYKDQRALRWLAAYYQLEPSMWPKFLVTSWRTIEFVDRARALGVIQTRKRHFTPDDIRTMLASSPFTQRARMSRTVWKRRGMREAMLFKDQTFKFLVFASVYLTPRPGEWTLARVENFDIERKRVIDWQQEKKNLKPRNFAISEEHVFQSPAPVYPTLAWFLDNVRPHGRDAGPMILQEDGTPYATPEATILRQGINLILGPDSPGPHGLRRFGATEAHLTGYTQDALGKLLGDTWDNIKGSYIDWDRVDDHDVPMANSKRPRPARPMLASNGKPRFSPPNKASRAPEEGVPVTGNPPPPEFSSGLQSGSVQTLPGVPARNGGVRRGRRRPPPPRNGRAEPNQEPADTAGSPPFFLTTGAAA